MSLIEINTWSNWSGFQQSHPEYIKRPFVHDKKR